MDEILGDATHLWDLLVPRPGEQNIIYFSKILN